MSGGFGFLGGIFGKKPAAPAPKAPEPKPPVTGKPDLLLELIKESKKWVGVREKGGNNRGPEVERFQKAVDGKAEREAWCMSFVQFCVEEIEGRHGAKSPVYKTEHCLTAFNRSPQMVRSKTPFPGAIVIWQHGDTTSGHTGIVVDVIDQAMMLVCEGNTGPESGVNREGDGVYLKHRSTKGSGSMKVVGYLRPFI
jgi:hypothetical protein